MTEQDFMIGLPNRSQMMMVTKTRKPRPMNSALPQGRGRGALMLGQRAKRPVSGRAAQPPEPPAQLLKPDAMSLMPMSMTVGPVTSGGKIRLRAFGGQKLIRISIRAQQHCVPNIAPSREKIRTWYNCTAVHCYSHPRGHGNLFPSASSGHIPFAYICPNAPVATMFH